MGILYFFLGLLGSLAVIFLIWLFFVGTKSGKCVGRLRTVKYAHRGLHGAVGYDDVCCENSLTAFNRACEQGYGIELDVRMSKDGVVMVFHDPNLKRVCGVDKRVIDMTAEELGSIHLNGTEDCVPTFRQVLDLVDGRAPLLVELKGEDTNTDVAIKTMELLREYKGEYIIESFNPMLLRAIKKIAPEVPRGFLDTKHTASKTRKTLKYFLIQHFFLNFLSRPHFIAMDKSRYNMFPMKLICKIFGTAMMTWTVRSLKEEELAYEHGFEGIIFEKYLSPKEEKKDA